MTFPATPGANGTIHREDHQDFTAQGGRWNKTPFSKGYVFADSAGSPQLFNARMTSPAQNFIRVSAVLRPVNHDDFHLTIGNLAGNQIALNTTNVAQRWALVSWSDSGMNISDWNTQRPLSTGISINGTRAYAGLTDNKPAECTLNLMKVTDTVTAMRMRTLYHSTGNSSQLVNAMFYLMHPITDIGKFTISHERQSSILTMASMAIEWW